MGTNRLVRVNELIQHALAGQLFRVINHPDFNAAVVTVTHVVTSHDLRHARVFVSINAPPAEQQRMMGLLRRARVELQSELAQEVILKYTPQLIFELDQSLAKGDHVLGLIAGIEKEHPDWDNGKPDPDEPKA